ncbi:MAG: CAP domain-containing protein [Actinomycetes bacterium]
MAGRRRAELSTTSSMGPLAPAGGRRRLIVFSALLATAALLAAIVLPLAWRPAATDVEASAEASSLLTLVNQARANNGLAPLSSAADLTAIAADRASAMAKSGTLAHTPDLGGRACCWTWIGENVAFAGSVSSLHDVLMNSSPHRANILKADADDVGIAVVRGGGSLWAAQVFRARSDADRSSDAGAGSRDGERDAPTGSPSTTTGGESTTGSPTSTGEPVLSPAELRRQELRQVIRGAREKMWADRKKNGPFDPVRAAVRYSDTLEQVSR